MAIKDLSVNFDSVNVGTNVKFNPIMQKNLHVFPHKNKWGIKGEGNTKFTKLFDDQKSAIIYARMIANRQKLQVFIHDNEKIKD